MPIINPPAFMQAGTFSARITRMAFNDMLESGGVLTNDSFAVGPYTPNTMNLYARPGQAYIPGTEIFGQGLYFVDSPSNTHIPMLPNNGSGPRKDTVYLAIKDSSVSGGVDTAVIDVAIGTEGGSTPGIPPENSISLAVVTVNPGVSSLTTSDIQGTRVWPRYNKFILSQDFQTIPPGWTPLVPVAPWSQYSVTDTQAAYRLYAGKVELKGLLRYSGPSLGGTQGSHMFTLPTNMRPQSQVLAVGTARTMAGTTQGASAGTSHTHDVSHLYTSCRINILTNGRVELQTGGSFVHSLMAVAGQYVSLGNISFDILT